MACSDHRLRLCVVMGAHWAAQMGGAQYQVKCLLQAMENRTDVEIYYLARLAPTDFRTAAYEIVAFGPGGRRGATRFLGDIWPLYARLVELRPNVIYQRGLKAYTGVCALYSARYGARLVFHVAHDDDVRRQRFARWSPKTLVQRLERRIAERGMRRADAIVVQTDDQARMLRSEYGLNADIVVPNFHPMPEREVRRRCDRGLRVIWVANFKPSKNPEVFVSLAEALADRTDIQFIMVGRPGDPDRYAGLHRRIERLRNLRYLGELPIERVNEEIARSHVFVNTSSAEGFPNTFIQAWLRGVPVVSCWVDPDGCLSTHDAGIIAGSPEGLIVAVRQLSADRELLEKMSASARTHAQTRYGMERANDLISLILSRPIEAKSGQPA